MLEVELVEGTRFMKLAEFGWVWETCSSMASLPNFGLMKFLWLFPRTRVIQISMKTLKLLTVFQNPNVISEISRNENQ